jgi:hypothetical protein
MSTAAAGEALSNAVHATADHENGSHQLVEAVVISGPRKGEIVHVDLERQEDWTPEEWDQVVRALRELNATVEDLLAGAKRVEERLDGPLQEAA